MERHEIYTIKMTLSERRQRWQTICDDFKKSGLPQHLYAKNHGLSPCDISCHIRKHAKSFNKPHFIPAKIITTLPTTAFMVTLSGGTTVTVPNVFCELALSKLVKALRGAGC